MILEVLALMAVTLVLGLTDPRLARTLRMDNAGTSRRFEATLPTEAQRTEQVKAGILRCARLGLRPFTVGAAPLWLVLLCVPGCADSATAPSGPQPQSGLAMVTMPIGHQTFTLEVADTDEKREIGLMSRDSMPASHGMIFVFPREEPRGFWMKDTRIPLDIIYVAADRRVASIHQMNPFDLTRVNSAGPAMYAIELNADTAKKLGVKPGDRLGIPPEVTAKE
jgi:uncharacterized membrane protein (UPF0127 family)